VNNSATVNPHWSRLLGLCPLVVIGLTLNEALLFGAALLLTLLLTAGGMALLQRWLAAAQRPIANALLAAIIVAALDLLLQAACYRYAQNLTLFSPLLIVLAVLLRCDPVGEAVSADKALGNGLVDALRTGSLFGLVLIFFAALRILVPADASIALSLIGSGLLLAATNKLYPQNITANSPPKATPRIRARATGPVR